MLKGCQTERKMMEQMTSEHLRIVACYNQSDSLETDFVVDVFDLSYLGDKCRGTRSYNSMSSSDDFNSLDYFG